MTARPLYIGGAWVDAGDGAPNVNPSDTGDTIALHAQGGTAQVDAAVDAARSAAATWAHSTPQQRFDALDFVGTELLARRAELGDLLAREEGKTLPEAIGEVARAGQLFKFFAGEAMRTPGEVLASTRPGLTVEVTREPVGVVGIVTPWNFPIAIPAWKIAPALAFGNAVVFKPAELVPGCAWALVEIIARAGLPAGTVNLVTGRGSVVGQAMAEHAGIDAITFTGSVATGQRVAAAALPRLAKVQLEMGGKNPLVVLDDADLERAVEVAVQGAFYSTGQRCTASSRLIVTEGIHDAFVARLAERTRALVVGDARDPATQIGPVVDAAQLERDLGYIEAGRGEGAKLVAGGERLKRDRDGFYLAPALFTEAEASMRITREEIFGPVATVQRARNYDEALALANDTTFGLSAGICTTSLKFATHFKRNAQAGMVMVNAPTAGVDAHVPFGGRKGSSYGPREQGRAAADFYTLGKTSYTAP